MHLCFCVYVLVYLSCYPHMSHVFTHNCMLSSHDDSYISERIHLRLSSFDFFCCLFCITVVALFMICVAS